MANISFSMTVDQIRNRTKTVTRRIGWKRLAPGARLMACVKCQGLKKGEKIERIAEIIVTDVRDEMLSAMDLFPEYGVAEAILEGFPGMSGPEFVDMFCKNMRCLRSQIVRRIEFRYADRTEV